MGINKDWFVEKINSFLGNDESNKMKMVDSSLIFDPDVIPYIKKNYGINIYGCGLCQVGVSCTNGIPEKPT